jgi:hypothetical protein
MCWNQYVSINTFVFSAVVLMLIAFNNKYSKYKIQEFQSKYAYFFVFSIISMQLVEFFIWRNINNKRMNNIFSVMGFLLLIIQPFASLMIIKNKIVKKRILTLYIIISLMYIVYNLSTHTPTTSITKSGRLQWNWTNKNYTYILFGIYIFFVFFSGVYERLYIPLIYSIILLLTSYITYSTDKAVGTMWCWIINAISLVYAFKLLIYLPYITTEFKTLS